MGKMIIGVDVAKEWIDIAVAGDSRVKRIVNSEPAIDAWLSQIGAGAIGLVVFEPTGGYERHLRRCLLRAKVASKQVPPAATSRRTPGAAACVPCG